MSLVRKRVPTTSEMFFTSQPEEQLHALYSGHSRFTREYILTIKFTNYVDKLLKLTIRGSYRLGKLSDLNDIVVDEWSISELSNFKNGEVHISTVYWPPTSTLAVLSAILVFLFRMCIIDFNRFGVRALQSSKSSKNLIPPHFHTVLNTWVRELPISPRGTKSTDESNLFKQYIGTVDIMKEFTSISARIPEKCHSQRLVRYQDLMLSLRDNLRMCGSILEFRPNVLSY